MTVMAYVLMEINVGKTASAVKAIRGLKGFVAVDAVTGPYDAIAVIEGETLNEIGELITSKLYPINGLSRTVTCVVMKS